MNYSLDIMKLQGEIRIFLIKRGLSEEESLEAACEIVDMVLTSEVGDLLHKRAYSIMMETANEIPN